MAPSSWGRSPQSAQPTAQSSRFRCGEPLRRNKVPFAADDGSSICRLGRAANLRKIRKGHAVLDPAKDGRGELFSAFELLLTKRGCRWKWSITTLAGDAVMYGFETRRAEARYKAQRAFFLLLSASALGCSPREPCRPELRPQERGL